jgi:hypothetical protein
MGQGAERQTDDGIHLDITAIQFARFLAVITNFLPAILLGIIVPLLAKVMTWYGLQPQKHQMAGY